MRDNTLLGKYCAEQLLSGRTIANKTLVALLKGAISLPECQHYGYVMDSFPTYLAFDEQIELVENLPLKPDFVVHIEVMLLLFVHLTWTEKANALTQETMKLIFFYLHLMR